MRPEAHSGGRSAGRRATKKGTTPKDHSLFLRFTGKPAGGIAVAAAFDSSSP
ncbi:hypothetical protein HMPREF9440_02508 [Sutterella parvirubra YIT 11816]|uniref:Uncharacterized protein n=1 Tax=Sutterella parvirubra YIT 11816 TaxID=762967 RepID=H3KIA0_9BURK|nr:hypothetical protein HMPREF9440_02508 [Sutterella parvirubra YIT 11816]